VVVVQRTGKLSALHSSGSQRLPSPASAIRGFLLHVCGFFHPCSLSCPPLFTCLHACSQPACVLPSLLLAVLLRLLSRALHLGISPSGPSPLAPSLLATNCMPLPCLAAIFCSHQSLQFSAVTKGMAVQRCPERGCHQLLLLLIQRARERQSGNYRPLPPDATCSHSRTLLSAACTSRMYTVDGCFLQELQHSPSPTSGPPTPPHASTCFQTHATTRLQTTQQTGRKSSRNMPTNHMPGATRARCNPCQMPNSRLWKYPAHHWRPFTDGVHLHTCPFPILGQTPR